MTMGEKIKALRKRKGISQEILAQMLGVSCQAVSKWENGNTMPDIGLIPAIAAYFGVSTDELFGYNLLETEKNVDAICASAAPLRVAEPERAEEILRRGLRQYPGNEKLLTVLLYTLMTMNGREADTAEVCRILIEHAQDDGIRFDAWNVLAMSYKAMGMEELVEPTLDNIPEFYFTRTESRAKLLTGAKAMEAARIQLKFSAKTTVEMLDILGRQEPEGEKYRTAAREIENLMINL